MTDDACSRFDISRPGHIDDSQWDCISIELDRLDRALDSGDDGQTLGTLKCLVEAIARIILDLAGEPATANGNFPQMVHHAHDLVCKQAGETLAYDTIFSRIAMNANKIAQAIGDIRNDLGSGHGHSRTPHIRDEMVDLSLDGCLMWSRWAIRRIAPFSEGRPNILIRDLIETSEIFHSGDLRRRLESANLQSMTPENQRVLAIAVGQRASRGTFVVHRDGVEPCLKSDDLSTWPADYRIGLLKGLWFSPNGVPTLTEDSIKDGILALDPIPDCSDILSEEADRIRNSNMKNSRTFNGTDVEVTAQWLIDRIGERPDQEREPLTALANAIRGLDLESEDTDQPNS